MIQNTRGRGQQGAYKSIAAGIGAIDKEIMASRKVMQKVEVKMRCECPHKDANGSFALYPPSSQNPAKSKYTGGALYKCKSCKKELDLSNIPEDKFKEAIDILDRVCDLAKMKIDFQNGERDAGLLKIIAKRQFHLHTTFPDLYQTIKRQNKKKSSGGNRERTVEIAVPTRA